MKKFFFTAACIICLHTVHAQITDSTSTTTLTTDTTAVLPAAIKKERKKIDLSNRSGDHLMVQYGFDNWSGAAGNFTPDGFSRFFNAYAMIDKPFKTSPKMSVGLGVGVGSSNIFFKETNIDIKSLSSTLTASDVSDADHFKKFKLTTVFLEAPIELRYSSNPLNSNSSFKVALGVKVGYLVNAHTKGKTLLNSSGSTLNSYIEKVSSKSFFNTTRLAPTIRIGYGILGLYGAYQITSTFKEGTVPTTIRPYSIGIYVSGL